TLPIVQETRTGLVPVSGGQGEYGVQKALEVTSRRCATSMKKTSSRVSLSSSPSFSLVPGSSRKLRDSELKAIRVPSGLMLARRGGRCGASCRRLRAPRDSRDRCAKRHRDALASTLVGQPERTAHGFPYNRPDIRRSGRHPGGRDSSS